MTSLKSDEKIPRVQYTANGSRTKFETDFIIFKPENIQVFFNKTEVSKTLYSIYLDVHKRGYLTFKTPPSNGTIITIIRHLPLEYTCQFQSGGTLQAKVLNNEFSYQMGCMQELAETMKRSMVIPPYAADIDTELTLPYPKAGKSIVWSSDGKSLENSQVEINTISCELDKKVEMATTKSEIAITASDTATEKSVIATQQAEIATQQALLATTGKLNVNVDNLAPEGKQALTNLYMPDTTRGYKVSLPFIAPYDGWVKIASNSNTYATFEFGEIIGIQPASSSWSNAFLQPLAKGITLKLLDGNMLANTPIFYPCKGS